MQINLLKKKHYKGFVLDFKYKTNFYYDVERNPDEIFSIKLVKKSYEREMTKGFAGMLYENYFEDALAYSIGEGEEIYGYLEVDKEMWNNRLRITQILILDGHKGKGYGSQLVDKAKEIAKEKNFREIVLETQTCNFDAINFYIRNGFTVNGIDLSDYTNDDVNNNEVRLEMAYKI